MAAAERPQQRPKKSTNSSLEEEEYYYEEEKESPEPQSKIALAEPDKPIQVPKIAFEEPEPIKISPKETDKILPLESEREHFSGQKFRKRRYDS